MHLYVHLADILYYIFVPNIMEQSLRVSVMDNPPLQFCKNISKFSSIFI